MGIPETLCMAPVVKEQARMPPLSPPYNFSSIMLLLIPFTTLALAIPSNLSSMILLIPITATMTSPLYDSSDSRETALNMRGYTPTPLPLQTFLSPPVADFVGPTTPLSAHPTSPVVVPPAHLQFPYIPALPQAPTLEAASSHTSYRRAEDYRARDYNGIGEYTPNSDYDYNRMKGQKTRYSTEPRDPYYEPEYHAPKKSDNHHDYPYPNDDQHNYPYHDEKESPYSNRPSYYPEKGSSSAYGSERSSPYENSGYKEDYYPKTESSYNSQYDSKEEPSSYSYYRPKKDYQPKRSYDENDYAQDYPPSGTGASESRYKSSRGYDETWNPTKDSSGGSISSYGDPTESKYFSPNYNYGSPARSKERPRADYGGTSNDYGGQTQDYRRSYNHNEYGAGKKKGYGGSDYKDDYGDSYQNYGSRKKSSHRSSNYDPGSVHTNSGEKHSPGYSGYDVDDYGGSYSRPSEKYGAKEKGYINNYNKYDEFYDDYTRSKGKKYSKFNYDDAYEKNDVSHYHDDDRSRASYDEPKSYGASPKFKPKLSPDYGNYDNPSYYPASYDAPGKRRKRGGRRSQYGSYSSLQPSFNSGKGEPRQAYDPTSWARWVAGDVDGDKVVTRPRRNKGYRRNSSSRQLGVVGDSSGWRGSSGPSSGPGGATTTSSVTTSHIIHHYKPETKDEGSSGEKDSVIGAIKKHLPPLPTLPWPFNGVRRMGVDEGEPIFIEDLELEGKDNYLEEGSSNYPDSIQSILESIEEEETSLAPEIAYPFLEEEDAYLFDIDQYNGYKDNNL